MRPQTGGVAGGPGEGRPGLLAGRGAGGYCINATSSLMEFKL
jgi:hypothetical protein